jgi:DNA repair exonuclease SbcCD ATPase subunit
MSDDEWMPAAQAAEYLGKTDRQLRRYKSAGRVRSRVRSGRVEYHRNDLDKLRAELPEDARPRAAESTQQIIPAGELLQFIREQQDQLQQAAARIGYLQAQLESRPALEDLKAEQQELEEAHQRIAGLEAQLLEAQRRQRRGFRWPWSKADE